MYKTRWNRWRQSAKRAIKQIKQMVLKNNAPRESGGRQDAAADPARTFACARFTGSDRTDDYIRNRRRTIFLAAASASFLMAVIFSMVSLRKSEEALSASIAPEILRFHVLANSDRAEDQSLKLEVKQMLIDTMYGEMNGKTGEPFSKDAMSSFVLSHRVELERKAERYMAERGFPYPASIRLEQCYFPTKIYGDVVFPCGTYDAVRVLLGSGEGKNWWCVLYPPLCFTDNAYGEVPDSSKKELENLLDGSDYHALMRGRRVIFGDTPADEAPAPQVTVRVKLRFPQLLGRSN